MFDSFKQNFTYGQIIEYTSWQHAKSKAFGGQISKVKRGAYAPGAEFLDDGGTNYIVVLHFSHCSFIVAKLSRMFLLFKKKF